MPTPMATYATMMSGSVGANVQPSTPKLINVSGGDSVVGAFGTPTIVHFCAVLVIAAILSAPWSALSSVGLALGVCGVAGLAYAVIVLMRTRRQTLYVPV